MRPMQNLYRKFNNNDNNNDHNNNDNNNNSNNNNIYIYIHVCACMDSMCDIIKYACICMYIRMYDLFLNAYDNTWNNWAEFFCSC